MPFISVENVPGCVRRLFSVTTFCLALKEVATVVWFII
jgi:hypothetical protein